MIEHFLRHVTPGAAVIPIKRSDSPAAGHPCPDAIMDVCGLEAFIIGPEFTDKNRLFEIIPHLAGPVVDPLRKVDGVIHALIDVNLRHIHD